MLGEFMARACPGCYSFACACETDNNKKEGEIAYWCQQCGAKLVLADKEDSKSITQPRE